jgi:hypothetical protein
MGGSEKMPKIVSLAMPFHFGLRVPYSYPAHTNLVPVKPTSLSQWVASA